MSFKKCTKSGKHVWNLKDRCKFCGKTKQSLRVVKVVAGAPLTSADIDALTTRIANSTAKKATDTGASKMHVLPCSSDALLGAAMSFKQDCPDCVRFADHPDRIMRETCDYSHSQKVARAETETAIISTCYFPHHGEEFGFGNGQYETMVFAKEEKPKILEQEFASSEAQALEMHETMTAKYKKESE